MIETSRAVALAETSEKTRPADRKVLAWVLGVGILFDLAVRSGFLGIAGALLLYVMPIAMMATRRVTRRQAVITASIVPIFAFWLLLRSSPWLIVPDVGAALGLIAISAGLQGGGSVWNLSAPAWIHRGATAILHEFGSLGFLASARSTKQGEPLDESARRRRLTAISKGLVISIPIVWILGALLASADPVFASILDLNLDMPDLWRHFILLLLGIWWSGGVLRLASTPNRPEGRSSRGRLGSTEAIVILVALDLLFGLFVAAQIVAANGGADHVLSTAGLTYAQYARSGFFQLLWVTGLTLVVLLTIDALTARLLGFAGVIFRLAACSTAVLTIGIAIVAFRRLDLYESIFGLTMLRFSCQVFAVWIAVVFAIFAVALLGVRADREWFLGVAASTGLVALFVFNLANPEAFIVRHNFERLERTGEVDTEYLSALSDDAIPIVVDHFNELDTDAQALYRQRICAREDLFKGWAAYNASTSQGDEARAMLCESATFGVSERELVPPARSPR